MSRPPNPLVGNKKRARTHRASASRRTAIGAVLLLGSLYWEGETGDDREPGAMRKAWRDAQLAMKTAKKLRGVPIKYGRASISRQGQFTMVFAGKAPGTIRVARLKQRLPAENGKFTRAASAMFSQELDQLARAEGIQRDEQTVHAKEWGTVAIAINPQSAFKKQLRAEWNACFQRGEAFNHTNFGPRVIDKNGVLLVQLDWGSPALAGIDFCLATPTKPDRPLPTPEAIARAIPNNAGSYFLRTVASGIKTADDSAIKRILRRRRDSTPITASFPQNDSPSP